MCIDLKYFYLGTPMNWYEYMWIKMTDIPQDIIDQYRLTAKAVNGKVLVEVRKGMYGLKQASFIANDLLTLFHSPPSLSICIGQLYLGGYRSS